MEASSCGMNTHQQTSKIRPLKIFAQSDHSARNAQQTTNSQKLFLHMIKRKTT